MFQCENIGIININKDESAYIMSDICKLSKIYI